MTITVSGGTNNNYGVVNNPGSPTITHVSISASGGLYAIGVDNYNCSPTMKDVTVTVSGATTNYGSRNHDASVTILESVIKTSGGTWNISIHNMVTGETTYTVIINNSQINGDTSTIRNTAGFTTLVGASQLAGGAVDTSGGGTLTCAGVYDEDYTFYASSCP
jgi:hypothetical protein